MKNVGDNWKELEIMQELCIKKIKRASSVSDLARRLGVYNGSQAFRNVLDFCLKNEMIILEGINGRNHELTINLKLIEGYVRNAYIFKKNEDFIHATMLGAVT
jgi:hypothetical protein